MSARRNRNTEDTELEASGRLGELRASVFQTRDLPDSSTGRFLNTFKRSFDYRALILHQQRIR